MIILLLIVLMVMLMVLMMVMMVRVRRWLDLGLPSRKCKGLARVRISGCYHRLFIYFPPSGNFSPAWSDQWCILVGLVRVRFPKWPLSQHAPGQSDTV